MRIWQACRGMFVAGLLVMGASAGVVWAQAEQTSPAAPAAPVAAAAPTDPELVALRLKLDRFRRRRSFARCNWKRSCRP